MACDRHGVDFRALERAFYEAEIDAVLQDPVALSGVRHIGQFEADIRVRDAELARNVGHQRVPGNRRVADPQDRLGARCQQTNRIFGNVDAAEDFLGLLEQIAAGFG